jgi:hypothetical protein
MNIFFLHLFPVDCARLYFNKHCIKIILEITQMLYTAHWVGETDWEAHRSSLGLEPYRKTHPNHPMSLWVRETWMNYYYALSLGLALCREYTRRYGKTHACQVRLEWMRDNFPSFRPVSYSLTTFRATEEYPEGCTPVPLCMPEKYHQSNLVLAYRMYYMAEKSEIRGKDEDSLKLTLVLTNQ